MANKLTVVGDISANGTIYGTIDAAVNPANYVGNVAFNIGTGNTFAGCCAAKGIQGGALCF